MRLEEVYILTTLCYHRAMVTLSNPVRKGWLLPRTVLAVALIVITLICLVNSYHAIPDTKEASVSDWNLYVNSPCGYLFKYPPNWKVTPQYTDDTTSCHRIYLISPNNPRMFDVIGKSDYFFSIASFAELYPEFEIVKKDWRSIPAERVEQISANGKLERVILWNIYGESGDISGIVQDETKSYVILLPPVEGGPTKDDIATFIGVLGSLQFM